jgi:hypothetical protein
MTTTLIAHDIGSHELESIANMPDGTKVARVVYGDADGARTCSPWYDSQGEGVDAELCRAASQLSQAADMSPSAYVEYRTFVRGYAEWVYNKHYILGTVA